MIRESYPRVKGITSTPIVRAKGITPTPIVRAKGITLHIVRTSSTEQVVGATTAVDNSLKTKEKPPEAEG